MAQNTNHVIKLSIEPAVVGHIPKGVWVAARLPARGELCAYKKSHGLIFGLFLFNFYKKYGFIHGYSFVDIGLLNFLLGKDWQ
jgi:hypothetical protein